MPQDSRTVALDDDPATRSLGASIARAISPGLTITLSGDLGAGKTTFTQGLLAALGVPGRVRSPTYTLVETYRLPALVVHHFDLYRFGSPDDWIDAGFDDLIDGAAVCVIEWPEQGTGRLPPADLAIRLEAEGDGRAARLDAHTDAGRRCLDAIDAAGLSRA